MADWSFSSWYYYYLVLINWWSKFGQISPNSRHVIKINKKWPMVYIIFMRFLWFLIDFNDFSFIFQTVLGEFYVIGSNCNDGDRLILRIVTAVRFLWNYKYWLFRFKLNHFLTKWVRLPQWSWEGTVVMIPMTPKCKTKCKRWILKVLSGKNCVFCSKIGCIFDAIHEATEISVLAQLLFLYFISNNKNEAELSLRHFNKDDKGGSDVIKKWRINDSEMFIGYTQTISYWNLKEND